MNNLIPYFIILLSLYLTTRIRHKIRFPLTILLIVFSLIFVIKKFFTLRENFESGSSEDDSRTIRYGDIITLYNKNNENYMSVSNLDKTTDDGAGVMVIDERLIKKNKSVNLNNMNEYFVLENANLQKNSSVLNTVVKYGDQIRLRTMNRSGLYNSYITFIPSLTLGGRTLVNPIIQSVKPDEKESVFTIQSTGKDLIGNVVNYGNEFALKLNMNDITPKYISFQDTGIYLRETTSNDNTIVFMVQDKYGDGLEVDWAKYGLANHPTNQTEQNGEPTNAIDGKLETSSATKQLMNPYWIVELPKDILISSVEIVTKDNNMLNSYPFDLICLDKNDKVLLTYNFDMNSKRDLLDKQNNRFVLNNVNEIVNKVKIQGIGMGSIVLNTVKVYGKAVNYSVLLEEEMTKNLIYNSKTFDENSQLRFNHRSLPIVKDDISILFFMKLNSEITLDQRILFKGKDKEDNGPHILVKKNEKGINQLICQMKRDSPQDTVTYDNIEVGKMYHIGVTISNGISPSTWDIARDSNKTYYVINLKTREMYILDSYEQLPQEFRDKTIRVLSDNDKSGFMNLGGITKKDFGISRMFLYVNGRKVNNGLPSTAKFIYNNGPLDVGYNGSDKTKMIGFNGMIKNLKYFNRFVQQETVYQESLSYSEYHMSLMKYVPKNKIMQSKQYKDMNYIQSSGTPIIIPGNILPYSPEGSSTVHFWLWSDRQSTLFEENVVMKGSQLFRENGELSSDFIYALVGRKEQDTYDLHVNTSGGIDGIKEIRYPFYNDKMKNLESNEDNQYGWHHIAIVIRGEANKKEVILYIDGKSVRNTFLGASQEADYGYPLQFGPFGKLESKMSGLYYANYALNEEELGFHLTQHPENKVNEIIRKKFKDTKYCVANPIPLENPNYGREFKNVYFNGVDNSSMDDLMKEYIRKTDLFMKQKNDEVKSSDGKTESISWSDYEQYAKYCLGDDVIQLMNNMVRTKDSGAQTNADGSKCLMQAPFKCQMTNLNDYPIQEHKDFYKYVETSKVQGSKDVDMTQYIAKKDIITMNKTVGEFDIRSHPELKNYILRSEIPKFTDSEEYKKMLSELQNEQKKNITLQEQLNNIQQKVQNGSVQTRQQLNQQLEQVVKTIEKSNITENTVSPIKADEDSIEIAINKLASQGLITEKQRMEYLNQIKNMTNKCSETSRDKVISTKANDWIKLSVAKNVCYKCDLNSLNDKVYKVLPEGIKGNGWVPKSDVYQVCKSCNLINM